MSDHKAVDINDADVEIDFAPPLVYYSHLF